MVTSWTVLFGPNEVYKKRFLLMKTCPLSSSKEFGKPEEDPTTVAPMVVVVVVVDQAISSKISGSTVISKADVIILA